MPEASTRQPTRSRCAAARERSGSYTRPTVTAGPPLKRLLWSSSLSFIGEYHARQQCVEPIVFWPADNKVRGLAFRRTTLSFHPATLLVTMTDCTILPPRTSA